MLVSWVYDCVACVFDSDCVSVSILPAGLPTMTVNGSFVSPTADAKVAQQLAQLDFNGVLSRIVANTNGWTIALTVLLLCVAYDQCE